MKVKTLVASSILILAGTCFASFVHPQGAGSPTVNYHATIDTVKYVYATAPPVAHLHVGNILEANSLDCFGNAIKKPGDTLALIKGDNPLTGPFYIDGAEPGDTLVVKVLDLKV